MTQQELAGSQVSSPSPSPHHGSLLLMIKDVSVCLGLGRSTVYALVQRGELPVVHIGRSVRVRRVDLEAFVTGLQSCRP